jgi:hypothetical protein
MAVEHSFECQAHGNFTAKVKSGTVPRCPHGCSKSFVALVFLQAPGHVSARTKRADQALKEAALLQGLADISTSPSRPGGTVAQRNAMRVRGPKGLEYPEIAAAQSGGLAKFLSAMTTPGNALAEMGFTEGFNAADWKKNEKTGQMVHLNPQGLTRQSVPVGTGGVSVDRVKA